MPPKIKESIKTSKNKKKATISILPDEQQNIILSEDSNIKYVEEGNKCNDIIDSSEVNKINIIQEDNISTNSELYNEDDTTIETPIKIVLNNKYNEKQINAQINLNNKENLEKIYSNLLYNDESSFDKELNYVQNEKKWNRTWLENDYKKYYTEYSECPKIILKSSTELIEQLNKCIEIKKLLPDFKRVYPDTPPHKFIHKILKFYDE